MLISLLMSLPSYLPLASLFVILCCSRCPFLSPAVSLSGLGVEFGDSVQWILLWLRPKLLRPHGAAAPPGPPLHFLIFPPSFPGTWTSSNTNSSSPRPLPSCVSLPLSICDILFRGNSLWFIIHRVLWAGPFTARIPVLVTACRGIGVCECLREWGAPCW